MAQTALGSRSNSPLFSAIEIGANRLSSRIVMAPLTRSRAGERDVPSPLALEYYAQRATAGLIISEATQVSPQGKGYVGTPGIYSSEQVTAWRKITHEVHDRGGKIFMQLWHVGRISHPAIQPNGALPVSPSAVTPNAQTYIDGHFVPLVQPRALETREVLGIVEQFRLGAQNAYMAGFDGVEIHAANGYLIDQFLRDKTNRRTDYYGGSIANRARLLLEITDAVSSVWGSDRVGVRISPRATFNDIDDSDPESLFTYVADRLSAFDLAYLHVVEGEWGTTRQVEGFDPRTLRQAFAGRYMANNCYSFQDADVAVSTGAADLVSFGRHYIANPDLVERFRVGANLNSPDSNTFYGGGAAGYTDYPTLYQVS
ncbi:alkene reductase [Burkholderia anthina]|uniref:alkene reductase n=1 Tax=Burkholderia anthina TaxID=179879 RepID=UPI000759888B|nr:alkene reductase [Burkholderia anthina]KVN53117.1 alkene reductase [Burkholderia anthina]